MSHQHQHQRQPSPATASSPTRPPIKITDLEFPQDATFFLGDLEHWMDEHYLVQVCGLRLGHRSRCTFPVRRPLVAANATRHPNNFGDALLITATPEAALRVSHLVLMHPTQFSFQIINTPSKSTGLTLLRPGCYWKGPRPRRQRH
jgi:hypothetical protein